MKTHVILIDFENVQPVDLAHLPGCPCKIKVFYGIHQTKVPIRLASELQPLGSDAEYIPIAGTGRNALDFHIAYYLGRLSIELPEAAFYVVSKDTGFDPLIKFLKTKNISCQRVSALGTIPAFAPPTTKGSGDRIQQITDAILNLKQGRPRKLKTLNSFIRGRLHHQTGDGDKAVESVIDRLKLAGMQVGNENEKITYPS